MNPAEIATEEDYAGSLHEWAEDAEVISPTIDNIRKVLDTCTAKLLTWKKTKNKRGGLLLDIQTANMLITVYDAMKPETQTKVQAMMLESKAKFIKVVNVGWGCIR